MTEIFSKFLVTGFQPSDRHFMASDEKGGLMSRARAKSKALVTGTFLSKASGQADLCGLKLGLGADPV